MHHSRVDVLRGEFVMGCRIRADVEANETGQSVSGVGCDVGGCFLRLRRRLRFLEFVCDWVLAGGSWDRVPV